MTDRPGAWLAGPETDHLFIESNTSAAHQNHIIAHELSHILLGHKTVMVDASGLVPYRETLMRTLLKDTREEHEAEALAEAILREIIQKVGRHALMYQISTSPIWSDFVYSIGAE